MIIVRMASAVCRWFFNRSSAKRCGNSGWLTTTTSRPSIHTARYSLPRTFKAADDFSFLSSPQWFADKHTKTFAHRHGRTYQRNFALPDREEDRGLSRRGVHKRVMAA